jgi:hypothetical protein
MTVSARRRLFWIVTSVEGSMNGIFYIVGLIVVVMFILSFLCQNGVIAIPRRAARAPRYPRRTRSERAAARL